MADIPSGRGLYGLFFSLSRGNYGEFERLFVSDSANEPPHGTMKIYRHFTLRRHDKKTA